jgi:polyhydroxyalkanoate synthesis regulator phasin
MKKYDLIDKLVEEKIKNRDLQSIVYNIRSEKDKEISELKDKIKELQREVATYKPMDTGSLEIISL